MGWVESQSIEVPDASWPSVLAAGDVDGDGDPDLIVGTPRQGRSDWSDGGPVYEYAADGGKLAATPTVTLAPAASDTFGWQLAVMDLDADGRADVAATDRQGGIYVYRGGAAGLGAEPAWSQTWGDDTSVYDDVANPVAVAVDGAPEDLVFVHVVTDRTDGSHVRDEMLWLEGGAAFPSGASQVFLADSAEAPVYFGRAASGDFDGDGFEDLLGERSVEGEGASAWLWRGGPGGLGTPEVASDIEVSAWTTGDWNGDGVSDVAFETDGQIFVTYGSPAGFSEPEVVIGQDDFGVNGLGTPCANVGDVDGDGYDDLVGMLQQQSGGEVRLYLGGPTGLDAEPVAVWHGEGWEASRAWHDFGWYVVALGDLDGDGYDDFALAEPDVGLVHVYRGRNDADGDGFDIREDCDDDRADVYPGAPEVGGDLVDQDCDGVDAPADTGDTDTGDASEGGSAGSSGCGCSAGAAPSPAGALAAALLALVAGRRRRGADATR